VTEPSRQGEVWRIEAVGGRSIPVVICDSTAFVARRSMIVVAQIREAYELPENLLLLAVPIEEPVKGVISAADLMVFRRNRFVELLGQADADTMRSVKGAIVARFDLDT
jgi:mRNA-degrading endonuclease toxin of MazEF toxin-antitoxin module